MMRMTMRRWFWLLNFIMIVAIITGLHRPGAVNWVRQVVGQSVRWVLTPVSWTFTGAQTAFNRAIHPPTSANPACTRMQEHYQNEIAMLLARSRTLERLLRTSRLIHRGFPGISSQQLRAANIDGFASDSSDTCVLDQGWSDDKRIRRGGVVMAQLSVVGRIVQAGAATSVVRLLTSRRMAPVTASIVRPNRDGQTMIARWCLVRGMGRGRMRCMLEQKLGAIPPQRGDLVLLNDNDWPPEVSGAVIGVVTAVTQSRRGNLRWDVHIRPRVNMEQTRHAVIVLGR